MITDLLEQELNEGDMVSFPTAPGWDPSVSIGMVRGFNPKSVQVINLLRPPMRNKNGSIKHVLVKPSNILKIELPKIGGSIKVMKQRKIILAELNQG